MKKILIVEDEKALSEILAQKIKGGGYQVKIAGDGLLGLEELKKEKFDLVISDILMPNMDGMLMLDKLRKSSLENKDIPVILLSNLEDATLTNQAIELGSMDFLVKSNWSLEDIMAKIKERLS